MYIVYGLFCTTCLDLNFAAKWLQFVYSLQCKLYTLWRSKAESLQTSVTQSPIRLHCLSCLLFMEYSSAFGQHFEIWILQQRNLIVSFSLILAKAGYSKHKYRFLSSSSHHIIFVLFSLGTNCIHNRKSWIGKLHIIMAWKLEQNKIRDQMRKAEEILSIQPPGNPIVQLSWADKCWKLYFLKFEF